MMAKTFFGLFLLCLQWPCAVFAQHVMDWERVAPAGRLDSVVHFMETTLDRKDSATVFWETNWLLALAQKWEAPAVAVEIYQHQGDYYLQVLKNPANALLVYAQAVDFANTHDLEVPAGRLLLRMGIALSQANEPVVAYEYFMRAHEILVESKEHPERLDQYELEIARFLYDLQDSRAALGHLAIADLYPGKSPEVYYAVHFLMGRCSRDLLNEEGALDHFQKCLQIAKKENNIAEIAEASVELGERLVKTRQYAQARIYLIPSIKLDTQSNNLTLAARALIALSKVNIWEGNLQAAGQRLKEADGFLERTDDENARLDLYNSWPPIYVRLGDFREAYRYRELFDQLQNSTQQRKNQRTDSITQIREMAQDRYARLLSAQKRQKNDRALLLTVAGLVVFGFVFGFLIYRRFKNLQDNLLAARQLAEKTLQEHAFLLPAGYETMQESPTPQASASAAPIFSDQAEESPKDALDKILHLRLLTEEDSRNFRQIFEKIHPRFFASLRTNYPELTQSETRLLALTKLNLSTKEMSEILSIESNSIRRLRNRVRQKLNLPAGDNFEKILAEH